MILCQQCTHENPYNRETCVVCDARLLIITNTPTAAAYGGVESLLRPTLEEHLLERISSLESQLERAQDRLELVLDLVHRQATSGLYDHAMLDALVEHLSERGAAPVLPIAEGDGFIARAGCDKRIATCSAKFANVANFRGFPNIPGQDAILRYASQDGGHEGTVL